MECLVDEGKTIIMVTHDNDIASRVRRSLHVSDGEIVEERLNRMSVELAEDLAEESHTEPMAPAPRDSTYYADVDAED